VPSGQEEFLTVSAVLLPAFKTAEAVALVAGASFISLKRGVVETGDPNAHRNPERPNPFGMALAE